MSNPPFYDEENLYCSNCDILYKEIEQLCAELERVKDNYEQQSAYVEQIKKERDDCGGNGGRIKCPIQ
jgi:hypothetical protein